MAKDPAFLFYPNDYIGGTMGMSFEEKGAYVDLLMMQFNQGHMTEHMVKQVVGQLWDNIKHKFVKDRQGLYYNERLEEEKLKRQSFTESRRNNASGKNQYTSKTKKHTTKNMTNHMEDVNEDVNRDSKDRGKGGRKPKNPIPTLPEVVKYFEENGYSAQAAKRAYDYYEASRGENGKVWKDAKGDTVLSWKQKMRGVWFKDENKITPNQSTVLIPRNKNKAEIDRLRAEEAEYQRQRKSENGLR